jgi:hypothetical protein
METTERDVLKSFFADAAPLKPTESSVCCDVFINIFQDTDEQLRSVRLVCAGVIQALRKHTVVGVQLAWSEKARHCH